MLNVSAITELFIAVGTSQETINMGRLIIRLTPPLYIDMSVSSQTSQWTIFVR